ncbi:MAG: hypothetical protein KDI98_05295 [Hyphomicrobiaceae bacterium]|nr:hypothetical protein [Hyphomicrobiaceae bacterium]
MNTRLVRYLVINAGIGMTAGWSIAGLGVAFNIFGMRDLALTTDVGIVAAFMIFFIFGTTFGSMQMGMAVMALAEGPGALPEGLLRFFRKIAVSKFVGTDDIGTGGTPLIPPSAPAADAE